MFVYAYHDIIKVNLVLTHHNITILNVMTYEG